MGKTTPTRTMAVLFALLGVAACASPVLLSDADQGADGLTYYLPKTLVKITIMPLGKKSGTKVMSPDQYVKEVKTQHEEHLDTAADKFPVTTRLDVKIGRKTLRGVLVDSKGGLVNDLVESFRLDVGDEQHVPDAEFRYNLQYQPNIASTDRVCMGVSREGLLNTVEAAVHDKTGDIVVSLAKFAGRLAGPGLFAAEAAPTENQDEIATRKIELLIDPLDETDRSSVVAAIEQRFPGFKGRYQFETEDPHLLMANGTEQKCPLDSVCYRTLVPTRLVLFETRNKSSFSMGYADVANRRVTSRIVVTRAFMVEKVTKLGFEAGVLTSVAIKKPSEALTVSKLPLTVYDAIVTSALAAPGDFLGKTTGGLFAQDNSKAIEQAATNAEKINTINDKLEDLRNSDLSVDLVDHDPPFKLKCVGAQGTEKG